MTPWSSGPTTQSFKSLDHAERQGFDDGYFRNPRATHVTPSDQRHRYDIGFELGEQQRSNDDRADAKAARKAAAEQAPAKPKSRCRSDT